jgi:hypothetical protein
MMKIKLKETLPIELTTVSDVVIMHTSGVFGREGFLNEAPLRA